MHGTVQCDVRHSHVSSVEVLPSSTALPEGSLAPETSSCCRAPPASAVPPSLALALGGCCFLSLGYNWSGWPCLPLIQPQTSSHFFRGVSPRAVVRSQHLGQQQECEPELPGKCSACYCRGVPSSLPWKDAVLLCLFLTPGFKLLFRLLDKANDY